MIPGALTPPFGGARYFWVITDDATQVRCASLSKEKSDAYDALRSWVLHMRHLIGRVPAIIRSDCGEELDNKRFIGFLQCMVSYLDHVRLTLQNTMVYLKI